MQPSSPDAMPVISRFYGIVVFMNYNDHNPPHLHARYQGMEGVVAIQTREVTGDLPGRAVRILLEWMDLHAKELVENWRRARDHRHLLPIEPLP